MRALCLPANAWEDMLDHEHSLNLERFARESRRFDGFFSCSLTLFQLEISKAQTIVMVGWAFASRLILVTKTVKSLSTSAMLDTENALQQEALGIIGSEFAFTAHSSSITNQIN